MNTEEESAELRQFREQWKEEVRHRREEQQVPQQGAMADSPSQRKISSLETHARSRTSPSAAAPETEVKLPTTGSVPGASH